VTDIKLKPGRIYSAGDDVRYLASIGFDGERATVMWARPVAGSPWQSCDAYEFRAWVRDSQAAVSNPGSEP
jgi:hypothetical protein